MNYQNYYLHGTSGMRGRYCALNRISQILRNGKIDLKKCYDNIDSKYVKHGPRIYLCDYSKPAIHGLESSYSLFIARGPSLVLKKDLPIITPAYSRTYEGQGCDWTNLYDEVRTDSDISLEKLVAITLPIELLIQQYQAEMFLYQKGKFSSVDIMRNVIRPALEKLYFFRNAYMAAKEFDSKLPVLDVITGYPITLDMLDGVEELIRNEEDVSKTYFLRHFVVRQ